MDDKGWTEFKEGDDRRRLSHGMPRVAWPPTVGQRIHYNSGWSQTSWTAEVRAVLLEDEVFVVRRYSQRKGWRYEVLTKFDVEFNDKPEGMMRLGSLPIEVMRAP